MTLIYRFTLVVFRLFLRYWGRYEVIGAEKLPKTGAVVVVANHSSYLDPPLMGSSIWRVGYFMARSELWDNKFLAWYMPKLNVFAIHQGRADRASIKKALWVLENGYVLGVFPEGTRSLDGMLNPAEPGVALIVQKSGAPVVPMALIGAHEMLPVGATRMKHGKLTVAIGDPLFFTPDSTREEITLAYMRAIAQLMTVNGVPMTAAEDRTSAQEKKYKDQHGSCQ